MEVRPRSAWGARRPRSRRTIATPTPRLWLHHTAGALGSGSLVTVAAILRATQAFHMDPPPRGRGWTDFAYSMAVDAHGRAWEGRGIGVAGGHTAGDNSGSHAIVVLGNFDVHRPSPELIDGLARLVRLGAVRGWWPAKITGGHRQAPGASTACPGRHLFAVIPEVNRRATGTIVPPPPPPHEETLSMADVERILTEIAKLREEVATIRRGTDRNYGAVLNAGTLLISLVEELLEPVGADGSTRADRMAVVPGAVDGLRRELQELRDAIDALEADPAP